MTSWFSTGLDQTRRLLGWGWVFSTTEESARALDVLAASRLAHKKYPEAEGVLHRSVDIRKEVFPDGWPRFHALSLSGASLLGQQKYAEAEPLLLQGYERMKQRAAQIPANSKVRLTEALERLIQLYDTWGKKDQAEEWGKKPEEQRKNVK